MLGLLPKRYSVRMMLVLVAFGAVAAFIVRDYVRVRSARDQYRYVYAGWQAHHITIEELIAASEQLASREADSPSISKRRAENNHIARMNDVQDSLDLYFMESSDKYLRNALEQMQENFDKYDR